jgi:hypothetical protein
MDELLTRFWHDLIARPSGPFALRFILQPVMAMLYAIRDGRRDARAGRPPYFWTIFTQPEQRRQLLRSGWQSIGKVFLAALIIDLLYQLVVLRALRPLETLTIAVVLAALPYLLLRGPINRLLRTGKRQHSIS